MYSMLFVDDGVFVINNIVADIVSTVADAVDVCFLVDLSIQ